MDRLQIIEEAGVVPTTSTLPVKVLGVNSADGKMFINTGTEIITLGGQGLLQPTKYVEYVTASTNGVTSGNNWVTLVSINTSIAVSELELFVEANPFPAQTGEVRVTVDGKQLPVLFLQGNTTSTVNNVYIDQAATGTPLLYCKDSLLVEFRVSSGISTWSSNNVTASIRWNEVEEL